MKYKCEKCNVNLEWYGITGGGQYKYHCPKCYAKYSKTEKGMNDIKEDWKEKEFENYKKATEEIAGFVLTQSMLNHFLYALIIDFLDKEDDWFELVKRVLEIWKDNEKELVPDNILVKNKIDKVADGFIKHLETAGFDISKLEKDSE